MFGAVQISETFCDWHKSSESQLFGVESDSLAIISVFSTIRPQSDAFSRSKSSLNDKHQQPLNILNKFQN